MARRQQLAEDARPLRLIASATRTLRLGSTTATPPKADWQEEAWDYFDTVPEVKYTVIFLGNAMAKLRVFVAVRPSPEAEPVPVGDYTPAPDSGDVALPDELVEDAMSELARLHGPTGGQGDVLRAINQNLEVAGEAFLVGYGERRRLDVDPATLVPREVVEPDRWEVRSRSEVEFAAPMKQGDPPKVTVKNDPGDRGRVLDPELDAVVRLWQPHPRWRSWPDCALRGVLNDCAALKVLAQQAIGEGYSHLNAGFFCAPNDLSFGAQPKPDGSATPDDDDEDPFTRELMEYLTTPIRDPASAASVVPGVIRGKRESLTPDVLRWIDIGRGRVEFIDTSVEAKARRLARGMNVPPEVMLGHQQTTFANAEQVDQDTFDDHLRPRAELICEALTAQYLRPALLVGHPAEDVERVFVWYDASALVSQPDPGEHAREAWQDGIISDEARRRVHGFDDADAPTIEERLVNTALRRGIFTADLTAAMLAEGGVDIDVASQVAEVAEAEQGALPAGDELEQAVAAGDTGRVLALLVERGAISPAQLAGRGRRPFVLAAASTRRDDPPGRRLLDIDRQLRERLIGAADAAMHRALERAGNRVKGQVTAAQRATLRGVAPRYAAATLGRSLVAQTLSTEDLLAAAWDELRRQFMAWGAAAQDDALEVVARVVGGFSTAERDRLGLRQAADLDEAWQWLAQALDSVAGERIFDPDPAAPLDGEFDPNLRVPPGMLRQAIARAGGAAGLEQGIAGAWVALTDGGTRPAGGIGTGQLVRDALRDHGAGVEGYRWVYGPAQRARPFEPHRRLDGVEFERFTDDVLANGSGFPPFSHYLPGDHSGCLCDIEPAIVPPGAGRG